MAVSITIPWSLACGAVQGATSDTAQGSGLRITQTLPEAVAQQSYTATIAVSGGTPPYKFSLTTGALPGTIRLDPNTGVVTGVPQAAGLFPFAVRVTDAKETDSVTAAFHLTVRQHPSGAINVSLSPQTAIVSSSSKQQFLATVSGTANTAVSWSASQGTIASDGSFVAPTVSQETNVTVIATSAANSSATASAVVTVTAATGTQPLSVQTSSLTSAQAGQPYSSTLSASGGKPPYKWSITGKLPAGVGLSSSGVLSGATKSVGDFAFTAYVADAASHSAHQGLTLTVSTTSGNFDGPAELPRTQMKWSLADTPAPGKIISVNAGGNIPAALAAANCGDTIELQAGATFTGSFKLPAKPCDDQHWIVIRTSAPDSALPAEGERLTPCYAGLASMPIRPAYKCAHPQNVLATLSFPQQGASGPVTFVGGANHYRLIGLEITRPVGVGPIVALILTDAQAAVDHIVIDRSWIHGTAHDETRRGVDLAGVSYLAIVDSYLTDFHCISGHGTCVDSQAISGGSGDLPMSVWQVQNNFVEAAAENMMMGGGPATTVPSDITIRGNHFYKPPQWMRGVSGFVGGPKGDPFTVKNLFEIKNATRVLFEDNILENNWGGFTQYGYAIDMTPRNSYNLLKHLPNQCSVCEVTDVTIRYNLISHVGAGISMANPLTQGEIAAAGGRYSIHDILFDDIQSKLYTGSGSLFMLFNAWPKNVLNSVSIRHITGFPDRTGTIMSVSNSLDYPIMWGFTFSDNLIVAPPYPIWSGGGFGTRTCSSSDIPYPVISTCFQPYNFTNNVIAAPSKAFPSDKWPVGNMFPATVDDVGFTNFNGGNGGNYVLSPSSPYKNKASDGTDPGANISAIQTATQGVN